MRVRGRAPSFSLPLGQGGACRVPSPAARMGGRQEWGLGAPRPGARSGRCGPSLGDLSSLGSDGSHLKNGRKKLDLETMDFWERGPRPRPEETKPDKDTPRPGGVRAGPEREMSL